MTFADDSAGGAADPSLSIDLTMSLDTPSPEGAISIAVTTYNLNTIFQDDPTLKV